MQSKSQKAEISDASGAPVVSVHTPLPWEYREGDYNRDDHGSAPGSIISVGDEWYIATIEDAPSAQANAAFIVRAVNSFDLMLRALEKAEELYQIGLVKAPSGLWDEVILLRAAALASSREVQS